MISEDEKTHGSMLVTLLLGSDKTTVSVATGQNDYYPLSPGAQHDSSGTTIVNYFLKNFTMESPWDFCDQPNPYRKERLR